MKNTKLALVLLLLTAPAPLVGCGTVDTSQWPDPKTVTAYGRSLETTAAALCNAYPACNKKLLNDADSTLETALNGYSEAYATGDLTQTVLDNLNAAEADILAVIADLQSKKKG